MVHATASAKVPTGTRFLQVVLLAVRKAGFYSDGAFDKVDVRLKRI
jgi:hypothetical protein